MPENFPSLDVMEMIQESSFSFVFVLTSSPATRYLDLDGSLDLARDLVEGGFVLENGELSVTDQPGLGVTMISDFGMRIAD
jgi:L-alanine-DL-glutamate epimerase-like enolase superfamily enzyme